MSVATEIKVRVTEKCARVFYDEDGAVMSSWTDVHLTIEKAPTVVESYELDDDRIEEIEFEFVVAKVTWSETSDIDSPTSVNVLAESVDWNWNIEKRYFDLAIVDEVRDAIIKAAKEAHLEASN
jgi:hypothetical protein